MVLTYIAYTSPSFTLKG